MGKVADLLTGSYGGVGHTPLNTELAVKQLDDCNFLCGMV
jgi:hypothetical protein